ncbi:MAG: anhydro-N-acetylmuramic acid kinase, partial [Leptolyngbyaceae cyanobacterium bins.59]|nr:anhydro-N-acetylmuramic acid kinase [Leptolyngbyaceae cyanobacterium bins.59]
ATLDDAIAQGFAQAALAIQSGHPPAHLIGSHGQTVYHRPPGNSAASGGLGYTLQLGRGDVIAHRTQIPTVSNFRVADIAAGGQGAPLVSRVDARLLGHATHDRCIQNLGGIGNMTYLPAQKTIGLKGICGWDTGPANVLLDLAAHRLSGGTLTYDQDGAWAATGTPCVPLVEQWLQQEFFQQKPPKSTGRELFGPAYLEQCFQEMDELSLSAADRMATLTELTVASIVQSYQRDLPKLPDEVFLCGGGSRNLYLKQRLQILLAGIPVLTTEDVGINPHFKEAIAFAVLAYWRQRNIPGNLPAVTGASQEQLLGDFHPVLSVQLSSPPHDTIGFH